MRARSTVQTDRALEPQQQMRRAVERLLSSARAAPAAYAHYFQIRASEIERLLAQPGANDLDISGSHATGR